ncbi:MAG: hypothetical protein WC346_04400 [Methanogenium sp.]|jgi:hypothetical protein
MTNLTHIKGTKRDKIYKIHLGENGLYFCNPVMPVSKKRITDEESEVTCWACQNKLRREKRREEKEGKE